MKLSNTLKYIATAFLGFIAVYLSYHFPRFNAELVFLYMIIVMITIYMYAGKKARHIIQLSFFWGIIYAFVIISLRSISRNYAILIGFPLIVLFTWGMTYCYRKKLSKKNMLIVLLATLILLEGPVRIINFSGTLISLPSFIFNLVAILIGNMLFSKHNRIIWLSFGSVLGCAVWMFCQGGDMWANKIVHGTYTGKISKLANNYLLYDEKGDTLFLSQMKGKIVLLDFWSNGCGVCWQKFPMIQDLYDKYRVNENIVIAGIFVEMKEGEYEENMKKFRHKYTFPVFRVSKGDSLVEDLSVKRFPSLAVLDADGAFRGFGNIELIMKIFNNLVEDSE